MKLLLTFIILNVLNVIIQTVKSIVTIKSGKVVASLVNAIAYGLYTIVTVYMLCELPLLWKVETSVLNGYKKDICALLVKADIPFNYIEGIGKYTLFNIFCSTQAQSSAVREILKTYRVKYFVTESKVL